MTASQEIPKKYSLDYSLIEGSTKISRHLKKGYLKRRDVTELVDQIKEGSEITAKWGDNGHIEWIIGNSPVLLNIATNKTPFWLRRIVHFFTCNSKQELKVKVEKIKEAYEKLIAKTAEDQQLEEDRLAEELAELQLNEKTVKMEAAKEHVENLKNEIAVLQEDFTQTESNVCEAELKRDSFESDLYPLLSTHEDLREALDNLNKLDQTIQSNFFGTWTLTDEEKFRLDKLEHTIFGDFNNKLREKESRIAGSEILTQKIQETSNEIETLKQQRYTTCDELTVLNNDVISKKEALKLKKDALDSLILEYRNQGLIPLEEHNEYYIPIKFLHLYNLDEFSDEFTDPALETPVEKISFPEILVGSGIRLRNINFTQDHEDSPLFNNKLLFSSICNEDEFYKKSLCPALKSACLILTPSPTAAEALYVKWEQKIKNLATVWKNSGSPDNDLDSISFETESEFLTDISKLSNAITVINYSGLKLQDLATNLANLATAHKVEVRR